MHTKMNTAVVVVAAAMILGVLGVWSADANSARPPAQATSIATVDITEIINGLEERQVLEDNLNKRREDRQAQLEEVVEELKILEADIQMLTGGTDEYRDKLREYMERQAVLKARRQALAQIISLDMGSVMSGLYNKVEDAISEIAEREGYDVVLLDDSAFPLPENGADQEVYRAIITKSVVYRHDSIDITQQVVTLMNNEYTAP